MPEIIRRDFLVLERWLGKLTRQEVDADGATRAVARLDRVGGAATTPAAALAWLLLGAGLPPLLALCCRGRPQPQLQLFHQDQGSWRQAAELQPLAATALAACPGAPGSCLAFAAGAGLGTVGDRCACAPSSPPHSVCPEIGHTSTCCSDCSS